jgi:hypothetical protein
MLAYLAITTTHSTGINWGQALGTGIPIVLGIGGILAACAKFVNNAVDRGIQSFAETLKVKFSDVEEHLDRQDRRFDRIDRSSGGDSR